MSEFSVGEVAVFHCPGNQYNGVEVTITSTLQHGPIDCQGVATYAAYHLVESPARPSSPFVRYASKLENLRKRRPPQDWTRLCKLDEAPVDAVSREGVPA